MKNHKLADLFPMMNAEEMNALISSMRENGYDKSLPITTLDGEILDGRNRFQAAQTAGVTPVFVEYKGSDPLAFVVSHNLTRRHLNETQRAGVAAKLANMERTDTLKQGSRSPNLEDGKVSIPNAAEMLNVGKSTVATYKAVAAAMPELVEKMDSGEMTAHEAGKKVKKVQRTDYIQKQRRDIEKGSLSLPSGVFEVINIDPPWAYGTEYDPVGRRAANPYPEMSLEEIKNIHIPAAEDCVLWLWTTHKFMRHSFELLDAWGFRDVMIVTWVKDRMGLGTWLRSQSEFCIMAVKGKPLIELTNQTTVINGKLREHSRKPDEFYQMVGSLCIGRKLDFFSREWREGWEQIGNDLAKFTDS
jgi:N6-adenosine-specific RNA methylase IME4/ParB-like chromosome segregation protein Spo0J